MKNTNKLQSHQNTNCIDSFDLFAGSKFAKNIFERSLFNKNKIVVKFTDEIS